MHAQVEKQKENSAPANQRKSKTPAISITQKKSDGEQGFGFMDNRPEVVAQRRLAAQLGKDRKKQKEKMEEKLSPKLIGKPIAELADKDVLEMLKVMGVESTPHGIERIKGKEGRERLASAGINNVDELFQAMKSASLVKESEDFPHKNKNGQPQRFYTISQGVMYFCINPVKKTLVTITYK